MLTYLKEKFPAVQFTWIMGYDTYRDLLAGKWKNGDQFQTMVTIAVVARPGVEVPDVKSGVQVTALEQQTDISSTLLRSSSDVDWLQQHVHPEVLKYMQEHKLYGFERAECGDETCNKMCVIC
eukprot:NODE_204_length_1649_cov_226.778750_g139_i0.p6 GENE.NODE_204_length_1649_cov_226.778750_g139_i0~~NODE_204_length_1649_cov_226.778750_g139_i0.p6  ORF type:complete len:123 (-),score=48.88 NODE_204_length_1649_cov_226.778750_g139_i0:522-890(-)